ncbi:MAG: hypothetical protein JWQ09_3731, partial [Segetibacter sp.]|nr:hypothetical protein [Segetibacter sp.]
MIFNFSNVGCIEEASIELKGLTIITGLNDSGKSYLTKSIFSIIKTLNQVGSEDKRKQIETAQNFINQVFSLCSQIVFITPEINSKINPSVVIPEIISNIEANTSLRGVNKIISNYQENVIKIINSISTSDEQAKKNVLQSIDDEYNYARPILSSKNNNQDKLSSFFSDTIIKGFFHDQLSNLNRPNLKIELREGQNILLEIEVRNKTVRKFKQHFPIIYKDATLIETPIILQIARYFNFTLAFGFTSF